MDRNERSGADQEQPVDVPAVTQEVIDLVLSHQGYGNGGPHADVEQALRSALHRAWAQGQADAQDLTRGTGRNPY